MPARVLLDDIGALGLRVDENEVVGKLVEHLVPNVQAEEKNCVLPYQLVRIHQLAAPVDKNFASFPQMPRKVRTPFVLVQDIAVKAAAFHECERTSWHR